MAQYRYAGPGPQEVRLKTVLTLVRPGDVWEFPEEPPFGPWEAIEAPAAAPDAPTTTEPLAKNGK